MQVRFGFTQNILLETSAVVSQAVSLLIGSRPKPSLEKMLIFCEPQREQSRKNEIAPS